ncbi:hypothetical protein [Blastopirellula marina]|nr:hypothetical protein [Blastopirellula marina]
MDVFHLTDWKETVRTALGRGGHLLAILVAASLAMVYISGGQLLENPAKLVIGGFVLGSILDLMISTTWRNLLSVKCPRRDVSDIA